MALGGAMVKLPKGVEEERASTLFVNRMASFPTFKKKKRKEESLKVPNVF
jgi:hypothetical protein